MNKNKYIGIIIAIIIFLSNTFQLHAQEKQYEIRSKALDIGVYNPQKVKNNSYEVLYGEDAEKELEKLFSEDEDLRKIFFGETTDENGNTIYIKEEEVGKYYPELGIVITGGGYGYLYAYDIKNKKEAYGDPATYAYSPSGTYRLSILDLDNWSYTLEKKTENDFELVGRIGFGYLIHNYYWVDEQTIYYLREREHPDGTIYWVAYSAKLYQGK